MNFQKTFEKSENKAVAIFVTVAILGHYALLWLFEHV
jgi:hypothetical protein